MKEKKMGINWDDKIFIVFDPKWAKRKEQWDDLLIDCTMRKLQNHFRSGIPLNNNLKEKLLSSKMNPVIFIDTFEAKIDAGKRLAEFKQKESFKNYKKGGKPWPV